jgi:hypothetical protein
VLGDHVKVRECIFHLKLTVQAMKGALQHHTGGAALINEFVDFIFTSKSEEDLLAAWALFPTKYPEIPKDRFPGVYGCVGMNPPLSCL